MSVIETMIDIPAEHERNVCGQFDTYLKKIERTLHVTMIARDGEIKIIGPEKTIGQAKSVFNNLIELSKKGQYHYGNKTWIMPCPCLLRRMTADSGD